MRCIDWLSPRRLSFIEQQSFVNEALDVQVLVARGKLPGPTLCLTAAIHGDELTGVEIARTIFESTDPGSPWGTLIVLQIVNVWGFLSDNRYVADRRDLNREFPGSPTGSLAGRIAFAVFDRVIRRCHALFDLYTGSDERTKLPQIRADLDIPAVFNPATRFDVGIVMGGASPVGWLRNAANAEGVAAILYEAGGPGRFEAGEIETPCSGKLRPRASVKYFTLGALRVWQAGSQWQRADEIDSSHSSTRWS